MDGYDWGLVGIAWLLGGMIAALIGIGLSTDANNEVRFDWSHPALYTMIVWLTPFALAAAGFAVFFAYHLLRLAIPRRVSEPVLDDLRSVTPRSPR